MPGSFPATKEAVEHSNNLSVREARLHCTKTSTKIPGVYPEFPGLFSGKLGIIGVTLDFVKSFVFRFG